jgi:hypothetical protein
MAAPGTIEPGDGTLSLPRTRIDPLQDTEATT